MAATIRATRLEIVAALGTAAARAVERCGAAIAATTELIRVTTRHFSSRSDAARLIIVATTAAAIVGFCAGNATLGSARRTAAARRAQLVDTAARDAI